MNILVTVEAPDLPTINSNGEITTSMISRGVSYAHFISVALSLPDAALISVPLEDIHGLLPSEHGTQKTAKARLWPRLSGENPETLIGCSLLVTVQSPDAALIHSAAVVASRTTVIVHGVGISQLILTMVKLGISPLLIMMGFPF